MVGVRTGKLAATSSEWFLKSSILSRPCWIADVNSGSCQLRPKRQSRCVCDGRSGLPPLITVASTVSPRDRSKTGTLKVAISGLPSCDSEGAASRMTWLTLKLSVSVIPQFKPAVQSVSVPKSDKWFTPAWRLSVRSPIAAPKSSRRLVIGTLTFRPVERSPRLSEVVTPGLRVSSLSMRM